MIEIMNLRMDKPQHPWDVKVCRGVSPLGNPFHMKDEQDRDRVCNEYESWFQDSLEAEDEAGDAFREELNRLITMYYKQRQLRLFCWCAPKRCHAETIRKYILKIVQSLDLS